MKLIIFVALALVALAASAPAETEPIKILRSEFEQQPEGAYNFGFETENGISRNENGEIRQVLDEEKKPHDVVVVRGSYSYLKEDGQTETINYFADETGFHPEGESIPKAQ